MSVARVFLSASFATPSTHRTKVATGSLTLRAAETATAPSSEFFWSNRCDRAAASSTGGVCVIILIEQYDTY